MPFSDRAKTTALGIVQIFETGKPFGDYSAVAVLNDGAGISYGIKQFTHASGSLYWVLERFMKLGGKLPAIVDQVLPHIKAKDTIAPVANNSAVKKALAELGKDARMQRAQREIAFEKYLAPAINACDGDDFVYPLSLAVIYDSMVHGSFARIRDKTVVHRPGNGSMKPEEYEREWIKAYVRNRHTWLRSIPRLKVTSYRTAFFLGEISAGNWELDLPITVHGRALTESVLGSFEFYNGDEFDDELVPEIELEIAAGSGEGRGTRDEALPDPLLPVPDHVESMLSGQRDEVPTQQAEAIVNIGDQPVPANFVPEEVAVDAPPPTGFLGKIKAHIVSLGIGTGTLAGLKEYLGIQLSPETAELLKVLLPTVLGLGFIGFLVWYVSEKVVGFKTLKMQSEINSDPARHNVRIRPQ